MPTLMWLHQRLGVVQQRSTKSSCLRHSSDRAPRLLRALTRAMLSAGELKFDPSHDVPASSAECVRLRCCDAVAAAVKQVLEKDPGPLPRTNGQGPTQQGPRPGAGPGSTGRSAVCRAPGQGGAVETKTRTPGHGHGNRPGLSLMTIIISYQPVLNNRPRDS